MKKTYLWYRMLLGIISFIMLLFCTGCQEEMVTFKIAEVQRSYGISTEESFESGQKVQQEALAKANATLEDHDLPYRLEGEVFRYADREEMDLSAYDLIVYDFQRLPIAYIEERFVDVLPELEGGALQPLYESMPPIYWESVKNNGAIYNITRSNFRNLQGATQLNAEKYEEITGETITEDTALDWSDWEEKFPELYAQNENQPFLYAINASGGNHEPAATIYMFSNEFRMITPYLGIPLHEEDAKVECIYESEYATEVKDWWIRQYEAGYGLDSSGASEQMLCMLPYDVIYPFARKNGESAWLIPFNNEVPMYAREAGANQSYVLIPKGAPHTEELYQLLNELALNEELAQGVLNEVALPLCPQILWLQEEQTRWQGSTEATKAAVEQLFEQAYTAPYSDFVFDETPIKERYQAVEALFEGFNTPGGIAWEKETDPYRCASLEEWSANWDANVAMLLEQMYDAGLQDIIDEANRQLGLE